MNCACCGRFIRKRKMYVGNPELCDKCNIGKVDIRGATLTLEPENIVCNVEIDMTSDKRKERR